ncbi:MAG: glycosyltransferase family 2 protein [Bryobacteraceae bacterium]
MTVWLVIGVAAATFFFLLKSRRNYMALPELPVRPGPNPDGITVIIPARNEEKNIERAVRSFPGVPVLVVDDASTDRTGEIARAAGARVIQAPPLSKGAAGKPNACQAGANASESEFILFVDADTYYKPEFLPSLMSYTRSESLDMVTAFLKQDCVTWSEKLVLPYAFALYFCGVNAENVNSRKSFDALANGQCLLFRRNIYNFIGGHRAVSSSIIEDVMLAFIAKRHRIRLRVLRAEKLGSVRMYEGMAAIFRGFEKNSFRFLLINRWCGIQVVLSSILLTSYLPVLGWLMWNHRWGLALLFGAVPVVFLRAWYGHIGRSLFSPAAIYIFQCIAISAMFSSLLGRGVLWKGRRV